jgi:hypothetical protein
MITVMSRLGLVVAASVALCSVLSWGIPATGAPAQTAAWTVVSDGIQVDVPASWPVFAAPDLPCPQPGGAVWLDQPLGLPAPACPLFLLNTPATMVVIGRLAAGPAGGTTTTFNGLPAVVRVATHGPELSVSADFPAQQAALWMESFGVPATHRGRMLARERAWAILDSVRAARPVYLAMPLPTGPPLALTVTAVEGALAPYDPTVADQGIPIEVVRYRLARFPSVAYVCQSVVRRDGKVVGVGASSHGAYGPESPPLPPGLRPEDQGETLQLSGPTFKGVPGDATVVCRPG